MSWKRILLSLVTVLVTTAVLAVPATADWTSGVAAFKSGDLAAAEAEFRAVTEERPEYAGGHLMLGQTLLRAGRAAEAVTALERAYELTPTDLQTSLVLGQTYVQLERFAEASDVLSTIDPATLPESHRLALYRARAVAALRSDKAASAVADLEAALEATPDDPELNRLLGQAAKAAGLTETALTYFRRTVELNPEDIYATRSLVQMLYSQALSAQASAQAGLCGDVMPHARRLVELDESYENLVLLAEAARCTGLGDDTRSALELAAEKRPDEWWPHYAMGRMYVDQEAWTKAEAAFQRALTMNVPAEEKSGVLSRLGYVYERQQQLGKALEQYRLAGDNEGIARVQKNQVAQQEEQTFRQLTEEQRRLEEELKRLEEEGGGLR